MLGIVSDVFLFILTHISLVQFSPGNVQADSGWGGKLTSYLMLSCVRNIRTKNY